MRGRIAIGEIFSDGFSLKRLANDTVDEDQENHNEVVATKSNGNINLNPMPIEGWTPQS